MARILTPQGHRLSRFRRARYRPLERAMLMVTVVVLATRGTHAQRTSDLPHLVAGYVDSMVDGLANVVAQEDFVLGSFKPTTVRSQLALVRYPGSNSELIVFRDVSHVNGAPLPDRDSRRSELFVRDYPSAPRRALEIAVDANPYVPGVLNPLFAIAFLQGRYQPRFKLAEKNAGRDWASTVKALTFQEMAKPTLLKRGPTGTANAPTKGTVWVDIPAGRILRTELEVQDGGTITKVVTTFGHDPRLKTMVPIELHSTKPDATATYSNFQHFDVNTRELLQLPPNPR